MDMATRSIMSSVNIKGRNQVKAFVRALEDAKTVDNKRIPMQRSVKIVTDDELKKIASLIKA